jgi:hypothetical protein
MEHRLSGHDRMRNQLITNGKPRLARIFGQCSESELSSRDLRGEVHLRILFAKFRFSNFSSFAPFTS